MRDLIEIEPVPGAEAAVEQTQKSETKILKRMNLIRVLRNRVKSHPGQAHGSARKKLRKIANRAQLVSDANKLKITVDELVFNRVREAAEIVERIVNRSAFVRA